MNTKLDYVFSGTQLVNKLSVPSKKKPDLQVGNKKIEIKVDRSKKQIINLGYFNYQNPNQILADKIRESELDISQIAEKVNLHVSMVSKQMKGKEILQEIMLLLMLNFLAVIQQIFYLQLHKFQFGPQ